MPRTKKLPADATPGALRILRDGVFPFADVRKDAGDIVPGVPADIAKLLIERGHAKPV